MATFVSLGAVPAQLDAAELRTKEEELFGVFRKLGRVIVAYSGGTDSAYLAWAAHQILGPDAVAITADSASIPESHTHDAEQCVDRFGIAHECITTYQFDNPDYGQHHQNRSCHSKD